MSIFKNAFSRFSSDNCSSMAAALAYYTIFALPPLLYLLLTIVGYGMSLAYDADEANEKARELITREAGELIGNDTAAGEITRILKQNQEMGGVWWKSAMSIVGILLGATGVLAAIQSSLNHVWQVQPDPDAGGIKNFVFKRILSFAMILGLGFLLLVSLVVSTVLATIGAQIGQSIGLQQTAVATVNYLVTFLVTLVVFAAMLKFMPDAEITWNDVWVGALVTSVLFSVGRFALGVYFEWTNPGAQLGSAAASLVVLLVWVYYTAMIFLLGAEFTQAWAREHGRAIRPEAGAVRIERRIVRS